MNTKIGKGIFLMLGIILTAYKTGANIWPIAVVTAILTGFGYYISNYWMTSNSQQGILDPWDFLKGAILAVVAALIDSITTFFTGTEFNLKQFGLAALAAFVSYVSATFFTGKISTNTVDPIQPPKG